MFPNNFSFVVHSFSGAGDQPFYARHVVGHAGEKDVVVIGPGNPEKSFFFRRAGIKEYLPFLKGDDVIELAVNN
jgi:hypothetical protein